MKLCLCESDTKKKTILPMRYTKSVVVMAIEDFKMSIKKIKTN